MLDPRTWPENAPGGDVPLTMALDTRQHHATFPTTVTLHLCTVDFLKKYTDSLNITKPGIPKVLALVLVE